MADSHQEHGDENELVRLEAWMDFGGGEVSPKKYVLMSYFVYTCV